MRLKPAYVLTTFGGRKHRKRRIETIRVGNAAVKIYRRTRTVDGNRYPTFEVCDYSGGRRRLRSFADHQAAQREARRIAGLLAKGDAVAAALSGQEAASFARCVWNSCGPSAIRLNWLAPGTRRPSAFREMAVYCPLPRGSTWNGTRAPSRRSRSPTQRPK